MSEKAPEIRNATVGVAVTPSEKRAISLVATAEGKQVSELLRPTIDALVERGEAYARRLREAMEPAA